jgi:hypothetical protein
MVRRERKTPRDKAVDNQGKSGGNTAGRCAQLAPAADHEKSRSASGFLSEGENA